MLLMFSKMFVSKFLTVFSAELSSIEFLSLLLSNYSSVSFL
jgi:hypothetical protein